MRCLLIGNFSVGNLGDEGLREYFLNALPETTWVVVSTDVPRLPFGLRSLWTPWWRTVREYWHADKVVFGGGSLFTDTESVRAPLLWWWHAFVAWIFRKPIILAFQGIGPLHGRITRMLTKWVVERALFISVRDRASFERVKNWNNNVVESFDPVFCVILRSPALCMVRDASLLTMTQRAGRLEGRAEGEAQTQQTLVVIPRSNSDSHIVHRAQDICAQKEFENILILSLQPSSTCEKEICKNMQQCIPGTQILPVHSIQELAHIVSSASFVLSERFHGALAALALGIPFEVVPQATDDKLMALKTISKEEALTLVEQGEKALRYALNI